MEPNWQLARKRPTLEKRARIVQTIRAFFIDRKFLEVETPQRIPANAPEYYIDAVTSGDWFLQTSPELAMKRLLAAGFGNIFQIGHCWRDSERGNRHLPEYSMLEWYRPHTDYTQLMTDCEQLIYQLAQRAPVTYQKQIIDLTPPWPRLTVQEAFNQFSKTSLEEALENGIFDQIISDQIEPKLPVDKPTFLTQYPAGHASLARTCPSNPAVAERFELYLGGMELANAFSELTDPEEQQKRFKAEEERRVDAGKIPYPPATKFLEELGTLPSSAGIALGIDRLVMLFCDCSNIDEVVTFTPEQL